MKIVIGAEVKKPKYYRQGKDGDRNMDTAKVAKIIEAKYGLFSKFANKEGHLIIDAIYDYQQAKIKGHPLIRKAVKPGQKRATDTLPVVERKLRKTIRQRAYDGVLEGVPTKAAQKGVNTRLKIKSGPERPSFIDGGAMLKALRVWIKK